VEEERDQHFRRNQRQLYDSRNNDRRQRIELCSDSEQHSWLGNERRRDAYCDFGSGCPKHHNAADKQDSYGGANSYFWCDGERHSAVELSVEKERDEHFRRNQRQLYDSRNNDRRQRIELCSDGEQHNWLGDKQCGDVDSESRCGGASNHNTAVQSNCDGGTDSLLYGGCYRDSAAELPMEEEWDKYFRGNRIDVYNTRNDDGR
jgi:hypothetical protein